MNRRIKFLSGLFLSVIIFIFSCHDKGNGQHVLLKTLPPTLLKKNGAEIFLYWEFKNDPFLWDTNFVQPSALRLYKDSISKILGKDTFQFVLQKLSFQDIS